MPARRFIDGVLHDSKCLIGEATQPQGAGKADEREDARIKTEEVGIESTELNLECHTALKMQLCDGLIAHKVVSIAHSPLRPDGAERVPGSLRDDEALFRDRQGAADVAESCEKNVQAGEKEQFACTVRENFRKRKSTLVFGANLIAGTPGEHRRQRQSFLKNHLLSGTTAGVVESGNRPFTPTPAFLEQRQSDEQGRRPGGEFDADRGIATLG